jgi:membrane protein YqaA with SNARE-associated domain
MFDNFIISFCKVQFLCYENEPNWLGLIVLLPLVLIVGLIIVLCIGALFGGIFEWFSDTGDKINNFFREKPQRQKAKKERKQKKKESKQN